ncbi:MAG: TonB-dependent receptor domain-containing protein, partial [Candidatus Binatia bacterium]
GFLSLAPPAAGGGEERIEIAPTVVEGARIAPDRTLDDAAARRELERIPGGTAVVGREEITDARAANLVDALEFVPGVMIRPRFGAADESQLSVRGSGLRNNFHLRGINVLIDGFPYGNADGFSDFESLELLATKRIEVYKGANALRFGGIGLGGAINLVTRTGHDAAPLEVRSEGGSFGFHKHYGATGRVSGPFDAFAAFTDTELDGFREHAEQVRRRFYATAGYAAERGATARLDLNYVQSGEQLPGALTREELDRDPRQAEAESVAADAQRDYDYLRGALTLRSPLGEAQVLEGSAQANYQDLDHPLSFAILTGETYSWSVGTRYILHAPLLDRSNRLTLGAEYAATRQGDVRFENAGGARRGAATRDQTNKATNVGVYLEEQHTLTERLDLVAGGRFQYAERSVDDDRSGPEESPDDSTDFLDFSPKLGFVYR